MRAASGPDIEWGLHEQLLAAIVDILAGANWQRAGDKRAPRPKPIPRPGVEDRTVRRFGKGSRPIDEVRQRLAVVREED